MAIAFIIFIFDKNDKLGRLCVSNLIKKLHDRKHVLLDIFQKLDFINNTFNLSTHVFKRKNQV